MWTPRRVLLLLVGMLGFGAAYAGYVRILGSIDGLPSLPLKFYPPAPGEEDHSPIPTPGESPTVLHLKEAFGADCIEQNRSIFPFQVEDSSQGMVLASGTPPPIKEPTQYIKLAPFSMAMFGKPRAPQDRVAGEVVEITTLHADEAVLQLDKFVKDTKELLSTGTKIIGMELRVATDNRFNADRRAGRVIIKNNQRSSDPNRAFEFKTIGPVFYRSPDHPEMKNGNAPHLWTSSAVEIVNKENLPRPLRGVSLPAVPTRFEGGLADASPAVTEMALGLRSPPVTVTADGMKIYLKRSEETARPTPESRVRKTTSFSGMRELILNENVVFHLWTDSQSGFPGASEARPVENRPSSDLPVAITAAVGALADAHAIQSSLNQKTLVTIRTLGPFHYDTEKSLARFEIAEQVNPLLPNNVELIRFHPLGQQDLLTCQRLEIEFLGGMLSNQGKPTPAPKAKATAAKATGPAFRALRATGSHVYLASSGEQLETQGTSIEYTTNAERQSSRTVLRGSPLLVLKDMNRLEAGSAAVPAKAGTAEQPAVAGELVMETTETAAVAGKPASKKSTLDVFGRGRVELFDAATRQPSLFGRWFESLSQSKDKIGDVEVDLLVFNGNAAFEDASGSFDLKADTLKLWLEPSRKTPAKTSVSNQAVPARLQGLGRVNGRSSDAVIKETDLLNVWFRDTERSIRIVAKAAPVAAATSPDLPPVPGAAPNAPPPVPFLEPVATIPPRENPLIISSRSVDMTLSRFPAPREEKPAATARVPLAGNGLQYELAKAVCDGRVIVHQEATEPLKNPRGIDITAATLHLDNESLGYRLKVSGTQELLATVQFENVFIAGPIVTIDQPNNRVKVDGRGRLRMPSSSDLAGGIVSEPSEMVIDWADHMDFMGEKRAARFVGKVQAVQRGSEEPKPGADPGAELTWNWSRVVCHLLDVGFDRPIYFNQLKRPGERNERTRTAAKNPGGPNPDDPKIEQVICSPVPADQQEPGQNSQDYVAFWDETINKRTGKTIKAQHITSRFIHVDAKDERTIVKATGPGETRTLQMGSADLQATPGAPAASGSQSKEEMKLTVVVFREQLELKDQKGIFQEAKYRGPVDSFHVPTDNVALAIDGPLPARSITLRCQDRLTVSSYRAKGSEEAQRTMRAEGEASVRTDDYDGRGSSIEYDGTMLILLGYPSRQATMYRRQRPVQSQDYQKGDPLKYNTKTGQFAGDQSSGGEFSSPPGR